MLETLIGYLETLELSLLVIAKMAINAVGLLLFGLFIIGAALLTVKLGIYVLKSYGFKSLFGLKIK